MSTISNKISRNAGRDIVQHVWQCMGYMIRVLARTRLSFHGPSDSRLSMFHMKLKFCRTRRYGSEMFRVFTQHISKLQCSLLFPRPLPGSFRFGVRVRAAADRATCLGGEDRLAATARGHPHAGLRLHPQEKVQFEQPVAPQT